MMILISFSGTPWYLRIFHNVSLSTLSKAFSKSMKLMCSDEYHSYCPHYFDMMLMNIVIRKMCDVFMQLLVFTQCLCCPIMFLIHFLSFCFELIFKVKCIEYRQARTIVLLSCVVQAAYILSAMPTDCCR